MVVDTDERSALRRAEQTRQLIEDLLPGDASSAQSPAVRTATARFAADDDPATLLARLEAIVDEARGDLEICEPVAVDA